MLGAKLLRIQKTIAGVSQSAVKRKPLMVLPRNGKVEATLKRVALKLIGLNNYQTLLMI
jgi:hypothetical protein